MYTVLKTRDDLKNIGPGILQLYKLCYVDEIPQTYYDDTPETKAFKETEEYRELKRQHDEEAAKALKERGSYTSNFNDPYFSRLKCQEYPNPEFIPGRQTHHAFFTPRLLNVQWGDDWDDRPYDCNAERPDDTINGEEVEILIVPFNKTEDMKLPEEICETVNCPYSVSDINSGAVAWIYDRSRKLSILAGMNPIIFTNLVWAERED